LSHQISDFDVGLPLTLDALLKEQNAMWRRGLGGKGCVGGDEGGDGDACK
jgi:hypothetical protein